MRFATLCSRPTGRHGFWSSWAMTRGGPGGRSQTLPIFMYDQAFNNSLIGYGTAVALLLLVVGALFSVVYLRLMREEV